MATSFAVLRPTLQVIWIGHFPEGLRLAQSLHSANVTLFVQGRDVLRALDCQDLYILGHGLLGFVVLRLYDGGVVFAPRSPIMITNACENGASSVSFPLDVLFLASRPVKPQLLEFAYNVYPSAFVNRHLGRNPVEIEMICSDRTLASQVPGLHWVYVRRWLMIQRFLELLYGLLYANLLVFL